VSEDTCVCENETYCPRHKYRWEYEQDEKHAHAALDDLGAPAVAGPFPGDVILSLAGRIRMLDAGRTRRWWRRSA
jgi:hypothetical protein